MDRQGSSENRYILGYGQEVMDMHNWRSAQSCAAHLLPHLGAGFRILDFGCGNGSISMGLASAVAPGELHGIDREESVIELARSAAAAGGHANANFHVGELTELPFEDAFFDAAHCHTVLLYVPDTQAALTEIKRVLKPGGILSCRERISASSFFEPNAADSWAVLERMLSASGTHPQMGKELKGAFHEAGFTSIRASASFDFFGTPEEIDMLHGFLEQWLFSPYVLEMVTARGGGDATRWREQWVGALEEWRNDPGAMGSLRHGGVYRLQARSSVVATETRCRGERREIAASAGMNPLP